MKKIIFVLPLFVSIFIACDKKNDVEPTNVEGTWNLNKYKVDAKTILGDQSETIDLDQGIILNLMPDGKLSSNLTLSGDLDNIFIAGNTYNSTYSINGNTITLNILTEISPKAIPLELKITSKTSNQLLLSGDKETLSKLLTEISKVDPEETDLDLLALIISINWEFPFTK